MLKLYVKKKETLHFLFSLFLLIVLFLAHKHCSRPDFRQQPAVVGEQVLCTVQ